MFLASKNNDFMKNRSDSDPGPGTIHLQMLSLLAVGSIWTLAKAWGL